MSRSRSSSPSSAAATLLASPSPRPSRRIPHKKRLEAAGVIPITKPFQQRRSTSLSRSGGGSSEGSPSPARHFPRSPSPSLSGSLEMVQEEEGGQDGEAGQSDRRREDVTTTAAKDQISLLSTSLLINAFSSPYFSRGDFVYPWLGVITDSIGGRYADANSNSSSSSSSSFSRVLGASLAVAVFSPLRIKVETSFLRIFSPIQPRRQRTVGSPPNRVTAITSSSSSFGEEGGGGEEEEGVIAGNDELSIELSLLKDIQRELVISFDVLERSALVLVGLLVQSTSSFSEHSTTASSREEAEEAASVKLPSVRKHIVFSFLVELVRVFTQNARTAYVNSLAAGTLASRDAMDEEEEEEEEEKEEERSRRERLLGSRFFRSEVDYKVTTQIECALRRFKTTFYPLMATRRCRAFFDAISVFPEEAKKDGPSLVRFFEKSFDASPEEDWA